MLNVNTLSVVAPSATNKKVTTFTLTLGEAGCRKTSSTTRPSGRSFEKRTLSSENAVPNRACKRVLRRKKGLKDELTLNFNNGGSYQQLLVALGPLNCVRKKRKTQLEIGRVNEP